MFFEVGLQLESNVLIESNSNLSLFQDSNLEPEAEEENVFETQKIYLVREDGQLINIIKLKNEQFNNQLGTNIFHGWLNNEPYIITKNLDYIIEVFSIYNTNKKETYILSVEADILQHKSYKDNVIIQDLNNNFYLFNKNKMPHLNRLNNLIKELRILEWTIFELNTNLCVAVIANSKLYFLDDVGVIDQQINKDIQKISISPNNKLISILSSNPNKDNCHELMVCDINFEKIYLESASGLNENEQTIRNINCL